MGLHIEAVWIKSWTSSKEWGLMQSLVFDFAVYNIMVWFKHGKVHCKQIHSDSIPTARKYFGLIYLGKSWELWVRYKFFEDGANFDLGNYQL